MAPQTAISARRLGPTGPLDPSGPIAATRSWSVQMAPLSAATPLRARSMFSPSRTELGPRRRNSQPMMVLPTITSVLHSTKAQLEKKVTDYLRNSQALDDYWQQSITAE